MTTAKVLSLNGTRRHWVFGACCAVAVLANIRTLRELLDLALHYEFASMIPVMPLMSAALIFRRREKIFAQPGSSPVLGASITLAGSAALVYAGMAGADALSVKTAGIVGQLLGGFLVIYGRNCFREALFPLLMLLFTIPVPQAWLDDIVSVLLRGSAQVTTLLFTATGTPFHREGFVFLLPGIMVEIAPECSGIRSSLALLVTCLLAGHLMLTTTSRKFLFVLCAVPMAMIKNGVRIVTLSLLAVHLDKTWLTGSDLHRKGGVFFYLLMLALMGPILWMLRRLERSKDL